MDTNVKRREWVKTAAIIFLAVLLVLTFFSNTKVKNAQKFLKDGNRVKVTVRFRGREMAHTSLGEQLLKQFGADCDEVATVAKGAKLEGRNMSMFLSPKNAK